MITRFHGALCQKRSRDNPINLSHRLALLAEQSITKVESTGYKYSTSHYFIFTHNVRNEPGSLECWLDVEYVHSSHQIDKTWVDKPNKDVTVVSPTNAFNFTPLLASCAVGTLEFRCAVEPVRPISSTSRCLGCVVDHHSSPGQKILSAGGTYIPCVSAYHCSQRLCCDCVGGLPGLV
jgi:hypothetical protein